MTDLLPSPPGIGPPQIDPRIARRWIDARRDEGRRRLKLLLVAGGIVACVGLAFGTLLTPLFAVRHIRIAVRGPLSAASIGRLAGITHHSLMVEVNTSAVASRLDSDPWLGAARVVRRWPGTVTISVAVRAPIAVVPVGSTSGSAGAGGAGARWAEVDSTGRVLADLSEPPAGMPQLIGIRSVPSPGAWLAGSPGSAVAPGAPASELADMSAPSDGDDVPSGAAGALAVLASLPPALLPDVLSINAARGAGLMLVIAPPRLAAGTVSVQFGDGSQLRAKLTALVTLIEKADFSGVSGLDLSVPARPAASSPTSGG